MVRRTAAAPAESERRSTAIAGLVTLVGDSIALPMRPRRSLRSRKLLLALVAIGVAVALAILAGYFFGFRDTAEPASLDEAVGRFRTEQEPGKGSSIPSGVYVYETRGYEAIDALGGARHRYPLTSTITVTSVDCGTQLRWDVLHGRSTTWTQCRSARGALLHSTHERHQWFGRTERTDYECRNTLALPADAMPGAAFPVRCVAGGITERGTGTVVGDESLAVGDMQVPVVHVRIHSTLTGASRGTARRDFWVAQDTGLPVRIAMRNDTTSGSLIGDVHYEEDVDLRLTSLEPRR